MGGVGVDGGGSGKVGRKKGMMQRERGGLWETGGLEKGESQRKCSLGDE